MLRFLLRIGLTMALSFSLCGGMAMTIGTTAAPPAAFQGFEGCAFPCWYGVPLSEMYRNGADFLARLASVGYEQQRMEAADDYNARFFFVSPQQCDLEVDFQVREAAATLYFTNCPDVNLGDWLAVAGVPAEVSTSGTLIYTEDTQTIWVFLDGDWFTWGTPIREIEMTTRPTAGMEVFAWYGVTPRWYYCQLTPEFLYFVC